MTGLSTLAQTQGAQPMAATLHAFCSMLATGCCEAKRTWREIEAPVRDVFGSGAEPLASAMRNNDSRSALAAAEALAAAAGDMA